MSITIDKSKPHIGCALFGDSHKEYGFLYDGWLYGHPKHGSISSDHKELGEERSVYTTPIKAVPITDSKAKLMKRRFDLLHMLRVAEEHSELADAVKAIKRGMRAINDMVAISKDDESQISYARRLEHRFDDDKRVKTTFPRYVRRRLGLGVDVVPDWVMDSLIARMGLVKTQGVRVFKGESIQDWYVKFDKISGLRSCMTHDPHQTTLYGENPDKFSLAVCFIADKAAARALLYHADEGDTFLGRVYSDSPIAKQTLEDWAEKNGYDECYRNHKSGSITVSAPSNGYFPYMDSFYYTDDDSDSETLTFTSSRGCHKAQSTGGCLCGEYFVCECCGDREDEDDSFTTAAGERICRYCYENNYISCAHCGDVVPTEDAVCVDDEYYCCEPCAPEHVVCEDCGDRVTEFVVVEDECFCEHHAPYHTECCECNENFRDENIFEIDGNYYCEYCAPAHKECPSCGELTKLED